MMLFWGWNNKSYDAISIPVMTKLNIRHSKIDQYLYNITRHNIQIIGIGIKLVYR